MCFSLVYSATTSMSLFAPSLLQLVSSSVLHSLCAGSTISLALSVALALTDRALSDFVSRECLHFIRRFWNQTFTWNAQRKNKAQLTKKQQKKTCFRLTSINRLQNATNASSYTCASVSPRRAASFRRSGFVMYFWIWNCISRPLRWSWLKTARDQERFRFAVEWVTKFDGLGGGMLVIFGLVGSISVRWNAFGKCGKAIDEVPARILSMKKFVGLDWSAAVACIWW